MLFSRYGQYWYGNDQIGSDLGELRAPAGSGMFPPPQGWEYWNKGWVEDPTLECGPPLPSCNAVIMELSGKYSPITCNLSYIVIPAKAVVKVLFCVVS